MTHPVLPRSLTETLDLPDASQVCLVVRDLDAAITGLQQNLGFGPFVRPEIRYDQVFYRGRPSPQSFWQMAFCSLGTVELELAMPITPPSIYHDFLESRGEGLHHVGFDVPDLDARLAACARLGIEVLQSGRTPVGGFAHLDTIDCAGLVVELIQRPRRRA